MRILLTIFAIAVAQILSVSAQENSEKPSAEKKEKAVPIIRHLGSRYLRCYNKNEIFNDHYGLQSRLQGGSKCANPADLLDVDFNKQTLIAYRAGGDCFVRARAQVFRNDAAKTYRVRVLKRYGGCRAGGLFDGWIVVEKIPKDYKVEFSEAEVKDFDNDLTIDPVERMLSQIEDGKTLNTRKYDLERCIQIYGRETSVIKSQADFLKAVNGAHNQKDCTKIIEKIDFKKEILVGATIYSGYCQYPSGLKYHLTRDDTDKKFTVFLTYDDPYGRTCRALGMYDLWLAIPKPPADYDINFRVASVFDKRFKAY